MERDNGARCIHEMMSCKSHHNKNYDNFFSFRFHLVSIEGFLIFLNFPFLNQDYFKKAI